MSKFLTKFILFALCIAINCSGSIFAQARRCNLQLDVFEYQDQKEDLKINNSTTTLYFFDKDRKKINANQNSFTFFANLEEGMYSVEVIADTYKKSVRRIYLDCGSTNKEGLVRKRISMWKGSPKELVNIIEDDDYNKVSDKIPFNDLASKVKKADYHPAARAVRASGVVAILIIVDELGDVTSARAISGHPLLQMGAVEAAKKTKFAPTMAKGKPAKIEGVLVYKFSPL
jgi:TonB family protein